MVSIVKQPSEIFQPSGNHAIFGFSGSTSNLIHFNVHVIDESMNHLYYTKVRPFPTAPAIGYFDAGKVLGNLVTNDLEIQTSLVEDKTKNYIPYRVEATEVGVSGSSLVTGATYTSELNNIYNGYWNNLQYASDYPSYITKNTGTSKFLTNKPNLEEATPTSNNQLYALLGGYSGFSVMVTTPTDNLEEFLPVDYTTVVDITAGTTGNKATAKVTITGTSTQAGDNIKLSVNGATLATFTAGAGGISSSTIAASLATSSEANTSGYTVSYVSGNTFTLTYPTTGVIGNSASLVAGYDLSAVTSTIYTGGTSWTATIGGYGIPSVIPSDTYINVGSYILAVYTVDTGNLNAMTASLVDEINLNSYGFSATQLTNGSFQIAAPTGVDYNGQFAVYTNEYDTTNYSGLFTGGTLGGTATTTTTYNLIGSQIQGFSGGTDDVPATSSTTTTYKAKVVRINTSPRMLQNLGMSLVNGDVYSVYIKNIGTGQPVSETRTYQYDDTNCWNNVMEVLFENSLGGVDSISMIEPVITTQTEKFTINKNPFDITTSNYSEYITDSKYNEQEKTLDINYNQTIKANTKILSDEDSNWLNELVTSRAIYIVTNSGTMIPVQLVQNSYEANKKRYLVGQMMQGTFEFKLPTNINVSLNDIVIQ